ncbi:MAG: tetrahydromethanopterin S-methyltransferase subunit H [Candidatus Bathyarchaeota archaeon]|nr:MAG: tetrahydromethanopterin S-methyltransferase subunit H [Candidatus Bathyarchaeota archaeon]
MGGQPGELPTVLIGNLFYKGMPEVSNHKQGSFDKELVSRWIEIAEAFSVESGVPHLLDIMAMYPMAISKYIEYVCDRTDDVFLVDGANLETRIAALETAERLGLGERIIYNGITPRTSKEELIAIQDSGIKSAVVMAFNDLDYSPEGRVSILKGSGEELGLIDASRKARIEKILVDTVVFDIPSISHAAEAIKLVKEALGYPAGCSPANATYSWKELCKDRLMLTDAFVAANVSAHTIAQSWGADFLIYGPIKQARNMIAACAINDAIIAYRAKKRFGIKPISKVHPLYKIF